MDNQRMLLSSPAKGGEPCLHLKTKVPPCYCCVLAGCAVGFKGTGYHSQVRVAVRLVHAEALSLMPLSSGSLPLAS